MHFFPSSLFALTTMTLAINASPLQAYDYSPIDAVARSMLGFNANAVSWESVPLQRSPSDPGSVSESLEKRIVYNPPITYPSKGTIWTAGQKVRVDWDIEKQDESEKAKDPNAIVMLGYLPRGSDYNEHLNWTLATGFALTDKSVSFTLPPDLSTRNDYIVVLFGDSGNRSKRFTIKAKSAQTAVIASTNNDQKQNDDSFKSKERDVVSKASKCLIGRDLALKE